MEYKSANSLVNKKLLKQKSSLLQEYRKKLHTIYKSGDYITNEASICLPFCKKHIHQIKFLTKKYSFAKNIILIGIGGSNLGCKAIYETFKESQKLKNIIFLDTINLNKINNLLLNKKNYTHLNTVIILISQSGKTTESIVNAELIIQSFPKLKKNLIIVSNKESILSKLAIQKNIDLIEIPPKVGGRYSVLSPIGLLPLSLCGMNIDKLLVGAQKAVIAGTSTSKNYALKSAVISFIKNNQYFNIHNTFIFEPRLEEIGKWVRQLVAESLGKNTNGIMPIYTVGSTDLHSIYQLFLQGPKNVFTCFLKIRNPDFNLKISNKLFFKNLVEDIESKNAFDIYNAIYLGVKRSYKKNKLPYCEYILENTNEENIGFFMQSKMIETMYLGFLMKINAFDQPGVEEYKNETREILKRL